MGTQAKLGQYCGDEDIIQKGNGFERGKEKRKRKCSRQKLLQNLQINTEKYVQVIQKKKTAHRVSVETKENNKVLNCASHTDGLTGTYNEKKSGLKMAKSMDLSAIVSRRESLLQGLWV